MHTNRGFPARFDMGALQSPWHRSARLHIEAKRKAVPKPKIEPIIFTRSDSIDLAIKLKSCRSWQSVYSTFTNHQHLPLHPINIAAFFSQLKKVLEKEPFDSAELKQNMGLDQPYKANNPTLSRHDQQLRCHEASRLTQRFEEQHANCRMERSTAKSPAIQHRQQNNATAGNAAIGSGSKSTFSTVQGGMRPPQPPLLQNLSVSENQKVEMLCTSLAFAMGRCLDILEGRELSTIARCAAAIGVVSPWLWDTLEERSETIMGELTPRQLSQTVYSFAAHVSYLQTGLQTGSQKDGTMWTERGSRLKDLLEEGELSVMSRHGDAKGHIRSPSSGWIQKLLRISTASMESAAARSLLERRLQQASVQSRRSQQLRQAQRIQSPAATAAAAALSQRWKRNVKRLASVGGAFWKLEERDTGSTSIITPEETLFNNHTLANLVYAFAKLAPLYMLKEHNHDSDFALEGWVPSAGQRVCRKRALEVKSWLGSWFRVSQSSLSTMTLSELHQVTVGVTTIQRLLVSNDTEEASCGTLVQSSYAPLNNEDIPGRQARATMHSDAPGSTLRELRRGVCQEASSQPALPTPCRIQPLSKRSLGVLQAKSQEETIDLRPGTHPLVLTPGNVFDPTVADGTQTSLVRPSSVPALPFSLPHQWLHAYYHASLPHVTNMHARQLCAALLLMKSSSDCAVSQVLDETWWRAVVAQAERVVEGVLGEERGSGGSVNKPLLRGKSQTVRTDFQGPPESASLTTGFTQNQVCAMVVPLVSGLCRGDQGGTKLPVTCQAAIARLVERALPTLPGRTLLVLFSHLSKLISKEGMPFKHLTGLFISQLSSQGQLSKLSMRQLAQLLSLTRRGLSELNLDDDVLFNRGYHDEKSIAGGSDKGMISTGGWIFSALEAQLVGLDSARQACRRVMVARGTAVANHHWEDLCLQDLAILLKELKHSTSVAPTPTWKRAVLLWATARLELLLHQAEHMSIDSTKSLRKGRINLRKEDMRPPVKEGVHIFQEMSTVNQLQIYLKEYLPGTPSAEQWALVAGNVESLLASPRV
ncbi:hypothetical protein CEUSTIGMA_g4121.t1 [Chlamydomonas eustigma]|uniref:Uncharacterized protein n=1 Tax=Chlamydomonas eustigma TaxID=1157962 RepID=A0A250X0U8_9CHLO|nr:hypothetical protein CEUSTIGMA_g4121.t1 [Chlamydomonas eustigma]|eukprot:GAX76675.1 hypothetical protein CEUSTIGMA_g4121.t1 [Chlamydomonas eustigma]